MGNNNYSTFVFAFFALFFTFSLISLTTSPYVSAFDSTDSFIGFWSEDLVSPNETINITGKLVSQGALINETVTSWLINSTGDIISNHNATSVNGTFTTNVTANFTVYSPIEGNYTLKVNSSTFPVGRNITVEIVKWDDSNFNSSGKIKFSNNQPPFAPGDSFTVNVTAQFKNGTGFNGTNVTARILKGNGEQPSWGAAINNHTNHTTGGSNNGYALFNFSIASGAEGGDYIVEAGPYSLVFLIQAYTVAALTVDPGSPENAKTFFAPSETVGMRAKVRTSSGTAVSGATVTAVVKYPNGTATSAITLSETTANTGVYDNNFTTSSSAGTYTVEITATKSGTTQKTKTTFATQQFKVAIVPTEETGGDFFFDFFAGKKVTSPGQNVLMDIKVFDLSDGSIEGLMTSNVGVICNTGTSNTTMFKATFLKNGSTTTLTNSTRSNVSTSQGNKLCSFIITTPSGANNAGTYKAEFTIAVNTSSGVVYTNASAFFTTQNYLLEAKPIASAGGDDMFSVAKPGENTTLKLTLRNITSQTNFVQGTAFSGSGVNWPIFSVVLITTNEFSVGAPTETILINATQYFFDAATDKLIVTIPNGTSGPTRIKIIANVTNVTVSNLTTGSGEQVVGEAFTYVKIILGFITPTSDSDQGGAHTEGAMFGDEDVFCADKDFSLKAFTVDPKNFQALPNVIIGSTAPTIIDEDTGVDSSSCFVHVAGTTASDSSFDGGGFAPATATIKLKATPNALGCPSSQKVSVTVNGTTKSMIKGFYFMKWPAVSGNDTDTIPGFMHCVIIKGNVNAVDNNTNQSQFGYGPTAGIKLTLTGVENKAGGILVNGLANITEIESFDPTRGPKRYTLSSGIGGTSLNSGAGNITVLPSQISGAGLTNGRWPSGFYNVVLQITDNSSGATDELDGHFQIISFQVFQDFGQGPPTSVTPGDVLSQSFFISNASTNITQVKITRMNFGKGFERIDIATYGWDGGNMTNSTNTSKMNPPWNNGQFANITVNFTVPNNLSSSEGIFEYEFKDQNNDTSSVFVFTPIAGLTVVSPRPYRANDFEIMFNMGQLRTGRRSLDGSTCRDQSNVSISSTTIYDGGNTSISTCGPGHPHNYSTGANNDSMDASSLATEMLRWDLGSLKSLGFGSKSNPERYCVFQNPFNTSQILLTTDNTTAGVFDSVVMKSRNSSIYPSVVLGAGNASAGTGNVTFHAAYRPFQAGDKLNSSNEYILKFDGCVPIIFSSTRTAYSSLSSAGVQSAQFGFNSFRSNLGEFKVNETIKIPLVITRGSTAISSAGMAIDAIFQKPISGFGVGNKLAVGANAAATGVDYNYTSSTTDANGVGFITMVQRTSGSDLVFWKVNSTLGSTLQTEYATFQSVIELDVRAFRVIDSGAYNVSQSSRTNFLMYNSTGVINNLGGGATLNINTTSNISAHVCAEFFNGTRIVGATVNVSATEFGNFAPRTLAIRIHNSTSGANITLASTTASTTNPQNNGCADFEITPTSGTWPTASSGQFGGFEVKTNVTATLTGGAQGSEQSYLFFANNRNF